MASWEKKGRTGGEENRSKSYVDDEQLSGLEVSWSVNSYEVGNAFSWTHRKMGRGERERSIKSTQENVFTTSLLTYRRGHESNNPNSQLKLELAGKDNWHCGLLVLSFERMLMDSGP